MLWKIIVYLCVPLEATLKILLRISLLDLDQAGRTSLAQRIPFIQACAWINALPGKAEHAVVAA